MGRDTPVGPPWMTTSSGYFLDGSKCAGLCSTPSMGMPSLLFQETSSTLPSSGELRRHVGELARGAGRRAGEDLVDVRGVGGGVRQVPEGAVEADVAYEEVGGGGQ